MAGPEAVGVVAGLRRYPVKSMLGEDLTEADVTPRGVDGDRAWALLDDETGKVVSVKRPRRWARMFELAARTDVTGVVVSFPDGAQLHVDDAELPGRLSEHFGRSVSVAAVPPPGAVFDESWERELKNGLAPWFDAPTRTEDGEEDLIESGSRMSEHGNFFNFGAVHLVTTGTSRQLSSLAPGTDFDPLRFRPNIVVRTPVDGFVETGWQGRRLSIGEVQLDVSWTVPRCVMTTLQQGDLPADRGVLRAVTEHNSVDCWGIGTAYPCVGVYADVAVPGRVRPGQAVLLH
jgi:uncharacterized protein YcbX